VGGNITPGSRLTCETCTNDSDCAGADHRCVEMQYNDARFPDENTGFCLQVASPLPEGPGHDCATPYVTVLFDVRSLSGGNLDDYCGIRTDLTTCDAVLAHQAVRDCANRGDGACPEGGFCEYVKVSQGFQELCTYACEDPSECQGPGGERCSSTDNYCGF
jgi:hypothetical protein